MHHGFVFLTFHKDFAGVSEQIWGLSCRQNFTEKKATINSQSSIKKKKKKEREDENRLGLYGLVRKALRPCKSSPIEKDRSQDKDSQSAPSRENKTPESMIWESRELQKREHTLPKCQ